MREVEEEEEQEEEDSKGQERRKEMERGNLEDCVPVARCSARGGLYYLSRRRREKSEGRRKRSKEEERWPREGARGEKQRLRRRGADITSSIMVQLLLCTTYSLAEHGERTWYVQCYCIVAHNVQSSLRRFLRL